MEFVNHTSFPALAFQGIDPQEQEFHVVVLRQTLTWGEDGKLVFADEQVPLCVVDEFFGEMNASSVRQESDLCHYKPNCDVIVNATAYAPQGKPVPTFDVRLVVKRPALADPSAHPQTLIDKTLSVTGERLLKRKSWGWQATEPAPFYSLPLRYEYAYGGQCRINADDPAAVRVKSAARLTSEQLVAHPDANAPPEHRPIAHSMFEPNPFGLGYAEPWYLEAAQTEAVPLPRIEPKATPLDLDKLSKILDGKLPTDTLVNQAVSFGIRPKFHPERRKLLGTIDQAFIDSGAPLPPDFDFAIWNAAPADQQTEFLVGNEIIELTNLSRPSTQTRQGERQSPLVLKLPPYRPYLLLRFQSGRLVPASFDLDTMLIEVEDKQCFLMYRFILPIDPPVRAVEARQMTWAQWLKVLQIDANRPQETSSQGGFHG